MAKISKKSSKQQHRHDWKNTFKCDEFSLDKCSSCSLIKTVNKLKTMKEYSETDIEEGVKQFWLHGDEYRSFAKFFIDHLPQKKGKLLDIGCGPGWFVAEANNRMFDAFGIDPSKGMIEFGKKRIDNNLKCVNFQNFNPQEKFSYVTLSHVIEHIPDLSSFLQKIKKVLTKNGHLLLATPNINSLMFKIFKCRWYPMSPKEHVWQFTPETLSNILVEEGFKIEKVTITSMGYNPSNIIKRLIFKLLTGFANLTNQGDQVLILAKNNG